MWHTKRKKCGGALRYAVQPGAKVIHVLSQPHKTPGSCRSVRSEVLAADLVWVISSSLVCCGVT